jgi:hypothetical protein
MREEKGMVRINARGVAEIGNASRDRHRGNNYSKNAAVTEFLQEKVVDVFKRVAPESWEILLSWLAYETERPLINPEEPLQTFMIKCAKKEGINFVYEKLCKLSGERIKKEE